MLPAGSFGRAGDFGMNGRHPLDSSVFNPEPGATQPAVAALFVEKGGCYYGLPNVDPWDRERDARLYDGPWPVVAHPPCERWGRYWFGGPTWVANGRARKTLGDDGGCFEAALRAV